MGVNERRMLKERLARGETVLAPGAYDPLTARIVEAHGFPAAFVGGFITGAHLACSEPLVTMTEQVEVARKIVDAVSIPVICDAGAGFGEPLHTARTVEQFEAAGVAAIHIEDQIYPKRISYFRELERVTALHEFILKLEWALKTRNDSNFLIIGRTDAFTAQNGGREETVKRGLAIRDVGADLLMVRGISTREELEFFRAAVPDIRMLVIAGAKWVDLTADEYAKLGYQLVIYATSPATSAAGAVWDNYETLKNTGRLGTPGGGDEYYRQRRIVEKLVGFERFMAIENATTERGTEGIADRFSEQRGKKGSGAARH
jgi:2-methylisocitrate lyase-like PEP mutase family enzyme